MRVYHSSSNQNHLKDETAHSALGNTWSEEALMGWMRSWGTNTSGGWATCPPACLPRVLSPHKTKLPTALLPSFLPPFPFLNFTRVDLQHHGNFCWTAKWLSHTYIYRFFFIFFSIVVYHRMLSRVSGALLFTHSVCNSLFLITLSFHPIPPQPSPLVKHKSVLHVHEFVFHRQVHLCHRLGSTYKLYHMYLSFSFWSTSLSLIISTSIHIAAKGIISFFLCLSNIPLYICPKSSLYIHLLIDIEVDSMSWVLWTVFQWT